MSDILFLFNAIAPLFVLVLVGNFIRKRNWADDKTITQLNSLCFKILIPCNLFKTIIKGKAADSFDMKVIIFLIGSYIAAAFVLSFLFLKTVKSKKAAGAMAHGCFRSNVVLLGIPLAQNILGDEGGALMAVSIAIVVPLFNVLGVVVLSYFSENEQHKPDFKHIALDIIKNPLIIATFSAFAATVLDIKLPSIIMTPIQELGSCGSPIAMLVLGARFSLKSVKENKRLNLAAIFIKLIAMPLIMTSAACLMGINGLGLAVIYLTHAAPSAATAGMLAENMGCDGKLAGEITLLTTALSSVTIFIGCYILMHLGVF